MILTSKFTAIQNSRFRHITTKGTTRDTIWHEDKVYNDRILEIFELTKNNNNKPKKLWRYKNKFYDLSKFLDKHPGGKVWLEKTVNSDITDFVEQFHFNFSKIELILRKYEIEVEW